jgi:predicted nuclease with RNAse H fold
MWFLGIDLAGSEKQKTGVCLLNEGLIVKTWVFYPNEEILKLVKSLDKKVRIIAIDAPLSLPSGRETIDDRNGPHFRQCDRDLRKLGIPFFPKAHSRRHPDRAFN